MKTISVTEIIDFKRKSAKSKQTFAMNVKLGMDEKKSDNGGNYWSSSTSAINKSFKLNNIQPVKDKQKELITLYRTADNLRNKNNYERNIEILNTFEDLDSERWRPKAELTFKIKNKEYSILALKGIKVKVNPSHIFTFNMNGKENIGAIWFIAKKGGLRKEELGIYTDILYKYLDTNYAKEYSLNDTYCRAVDLVTGSDVTYQQLKDREIPKILNKTIDELRILM